MTSPFDPPTSAPPPPPAGYVPQQQVAGTPVPPPPGYQAYNPASSHHANRASFGARLGGWLLDWMLYGLLGSILATPGLAIMLSEARSCESTDVELVCGTGSADGARILLGLALFCLAVLIVLAIYLHALGTTGQTWGRMIAGVKVVGDMTGEPIGVAKAIGRQLFAWFFSAQVIYLGYLWMLWDHQQQTWHDKVVGSIVVRV